MKEIINSINDFVGISNMQTASNLYTILLTFYIALYWVLWFFRRGERYKMFPNDPCRIAFVVLLLGAYLFGVGQAFDKQMEYYPFAFWSNVSVLATVLTTWLCVIVFVQLCKIRERLPKQD